MKSKPADLAAQEWPLLFVWITAGIYLVYGSTWAESAPSPFFLLTTLVWVCTAIMVAAFAVVRHAEVLAARFGEPYGTMILTFAVISLEVSMIAALMLSGDQPSLARDTMYSVVMIVLTLFVGLCLLLGGIKFREQSFNLQGANSYLAMILPLAVVGLVLPNFTKSGVDHGYSFHHAVGLVILSISIYAVFLLVQTRRYRGYFRHSHDEAHAHAEATGHEIHSSPHGNATHFLLLLAYIVPVVILSKKLSVFLGYATAAAGLPIATAGLVVALLILAPEGLAAIEAAWKNHMQRAVNLLLGSVLATIGLTIPAALGIGLLTGKPVILGIDEAEITLLLVTQGLCILTFGQGRTNMLQGAIHLLLFGVYLFLIFDTEI